LNLKGKGPKFWGGEKWREMGLWSEMAEGMIEEEMMKGERRNSLLMRKRSSQGCYMIQTDPLIIPGEFPFLRVDILKIPVRDKICKFFTLGISHPTSAPLFFLGEIGIKVPSHHC
jgi:hypothetical protein